MSRARPDLKRAAIAFLIAVAGMVASSFGQIRGAASAQSRALAIGGAALLLIAGVVAVRSTAGAIRKGSTSHIGDARGVGLSWIVTIVGYLIVLLLVLAVLRVPLGGLLFGGAITGVVLGIAAQQTLANFFAGIVLMIARPFQVGEKVVLRSSPLGGEYEGIIADMTLFYVHMQTDSGPVAMPNAGVLAAAIGPGARTPKDEDGEEEQQDAPPEAGGQPSGDDPSRALG